MTYPDCTILDQIPTGIFIISKDYRIIFWNRCLEEWTGLPREVLLGALLFKQFPHLDFPKYRKRIDQLLTTGSPTIFSSQLHGYIIPAKLPNGKFRVQQTIVTTVAGSDGLNALFSIQDVTSLTEAISSYNLEHRKLFLEMDIRKKAESELKKLNAKLKEKSIRDGLTGLYNHRHFWNVMRRDFMLAMRLETDLALLMIDLDFFKKVNDQYGHLFGDNVLKGIGVIISNTVRKTDIISRYGGEEFAILLPGTALSGALTIAENIRKAIEAHTFKSSKGIVRITISIGVATVREHNPENPEKLLDMADNALYCSKAMGRNRIISYSEIADKSFP